MPARPGLRVGAENTQLCPHPQQEFWLHCGGKPAAGDQARGWCSIPVGNRGSLDQGSNHRDTPKARATASGDQWVWTWRGRGAEAAQEAPGQGAALQEEGPGESQDLRALEETPGHRCQGIRRPRRGVRAVACVGQGSAGAFPCGASGRGVCISLYYCPQAPQSDQSGLGLWQPRKLARKT